MELGFSEAKKKKKTLKVLEVFCTKIFSDFFLWDLRFTPLQSLLALHTYNVQLHLEYLSCRGNSTAVGFEVSLTKARPLYLRMSLKG